MCSRERSCVLFFVNPARTCADTHVSLRPLVLTHLIPVIYRHYKLSKFAHPSPFRMRPQKVRRFEHFCSSSFVPESAGGQPRMQQHLRFSHPQPLTGVTPSVKPPPPTTTLSLSLYIYIILLLKSMHSMQKYAETQGRSTESTHLHTLHTPAHPYIARGA